VTFDELCDKLLRKGWLVSCNAMRTDTGYAVEVKGPAGKGMARFVGSTPTAALKGLIDKEWGSIKGIGEVRSPLEIAWDAYSSALADNHIARIGY